MARSTWLVSLLSLTACQLVGGGGNELPPPEGGSRRLVAEVDGPVAMTFQSGGYVQTIRATIPIEGEPGAGVEAFVDSHAELFGFEDGDHAVSASDTRSVGDMEIVDLSVTYREVPIAGGRIVALVRLGAIEYLASYVPYPSELDVTPTRDEAGVRESLDLHYGMSTLMGAPELVVFDAASFVGAPGVLPTGAELAWRVDVEAPEVAEVWVADTDGQLLARSPLRQTENRTVYDAMGAGTVYDAFTGDPVATEADGVTAGASADAASVFEHLATARDYFDDRLGWSSYDGQGRETLRAVVNLPPVLDDMMRPLPNAAWNASAFAFEFTAGMATADVTVHEYTHAVIDYAATSPPKYLFVPGAIEEALCDSFASFATPGAHQWVVAEGSASGQMIEGLPDGAARSQSDPSIAGDPAHLSEFSVSTMGSCDPVTNRCSSDLYTCLDGRCVCTGGEGCDSGGVHSNSGIANHIIYLASVGGEHATQPGRTLDGIGVGKMEQILFTSTYLLSDATRFRSWREDVVAACQLLARIGAPFPSADAITWGDCGTVINAFAAGGIGPGDRDGDSWNDDVDSCPARYNPEQEEDDPEGCITDPWQHCAGLRYGLAYDDFRTGYDIGRARNHGNSLIMTAQCAFKNHDYYVAEDIALAAAAATSTGAEATAWYIAEYAVERRGREERAEAYRENGEAASIRSGMCAGLDSEEESACAGFQRAGLRASLDNLFDDG